ncbi:MAG: hypothetical protein KBA14_03850 [Saprospiraceae bacterium]|nr:hypothetical protein [Saprospiraceae bacterium]
MLQFILGLFGCNKAPVNTIISSDVGPFTIETITQTGKTYNSNYGMVDQTTISYAVKYKGEPLTISDNLETNTGLPGIWRVFYLKDAPTPSLILGSQSLYLVTLENDKPVIKVLFEQGSDFASIQWLDSEEGQPGMYREVYSSDQADKEVELSGGRYMAITHAVVLDTKTFDLFPFNTNNEQVDGYFIDQRSAAAFSPDGTQVVYCAFKQDEQDYMLNHYALICYDFKAGTTYAVPFDKDSLYVKDVSRISSEWINDYFEWKQQDSGSMRLQLRTLDKKPYRKGIVFYERYQGYKYILDPVSEAMLTHLATFVQNDLQIAADSVQHINEEYNNRFIMAYQGKTITVKYGEYGSDLLVTYEGEGLTMAENKTLISRIGKGFNLVLNQGTYESEWKAIVPVTE